MAVIWEEAPKSVIDMARGIIAEYHPRLADARIFFIMRSEAPVTNGKVTLGKAKKVSADLQVHIDADFIIWLAKDEWRMLSPKQQNALVDHELSHCFWDGLTASMKSHDVEEFTHIIERYGFWWPNSSDFRLAVQEALPIPRETPGSVGTIDFGKIAESVAKEMQGDGVEVTYHPATGRGE
jgi:hypothetical protein